MTRPPPIDRDANDAAIAVIQYTLSNQEKNPMELLRLWNEGDFDAIKEGWPDAPESIFDQL